MSSRAISNDAKHDFSKLLLELIKKEGLELLTWSKKAIELQNRVNFINENMNNDFPTFTNDILLETLELWLDPYLQNITTVKELEALDIYTILLGIIPWEKQQLLETLAPNSIKVPSGSNIKIDYLTGNSELIE